MPERDASSDIPLAEVFTAANELRAAKLIEEWALGGALAAVYYVEPFTTYDADLFFIPIDKTLSAGVPAIYARLQARGWQIEGDHLVVSGFPVQFLAAAGLTEEAIREAEGILFEGVEGRVFRAEYLAAIAASVGRRKDLARIGQLLDQSNIDKTKLDTILRRYKLELPKL